MNREGAKGEQPFKTDTCQCICQFIQIWIDGMQALWSVHGNATESSSTESDNVKKEENNRSYIWYQLELQLIKRTSDDRPCHEHSLRIEPSTDDITLLGNNQQFPKDARPEIAAHIGEYILKTKRFF